MCMDLDFRMFLGLILLVGCQPATPPAPQSPAPVESAAPTSPAPVSPEPVVKAPTSLVLSTEGTGEYFEFPKAGIKLRLPDGLDRAKLFDGFHRPGTPVTVEMTHIKVPYEQFSKLFTPETLSGQGKSVHGREEILINDAPAILAHYEVPAGKSSNVSWALLTVANNRTMLITANVSASVAPDWETRLKNCILSVQSIPLEETSVDAETPGQR